MSKTPSFSGIFDNTDLDAAKEANVDQAYRKTTFRQKMESLGDPATVEELRRLVFEDNIPDDFQSGELMTIFTSFRRHKSWDDMLRLVDESGNHEFTDAAIVRELSAVACNMTEQFDRTIDICQKLLDDGLENGEVYGALGKAYLKKGDLKKSSEYYEKGFLIDFETYPGINVAYREIEMGNIEKAKNVAEILQMASLRDGVRDTKDYWVLAIEFESAAIRDASPQEIDEIFARIESLPADSLETWMLESSLGAMKRIRECYENSGTVPENFSYAVNKLEGGLTKLSFQRSADPEATEEREMDISQSLVEQSFSYRGLASNFIGQHFVSGNFRYGGQLPDHSLTRTDWAEFQKLTNVPLKDLLGEQEASHLPATMAEITDTEIFLGVADKVIRTAFRTDENNLEDIMGEGHSRYDETVHALLNLSGIEAGTTDRRLSDSRTNISVILGLGLGDCRHHAQAKQLLFDVWQKQHMNGHLRTAYNALQEGDETTFQKEIDAFRAVEFQELRTFDVVVEAPIEINGPYSPVHNESGMLVAKDDSTMSTVEEHTMTILIRRDANHKVGSVHFADSFYQNHYQWGDGEIDASEILINDDGQITIPGNTIAVHDNETGQSIQVPVELRPTVYAGKKDQIAGDEHGKLLLLGIPVEEDFDLFERLTEAPEERRGRLDNLRNWYVDKGNMPDILKQRFGGTDTPGNNIS